MDCLRQNEPIKEGVLGHPAIPVEKWKQLSWVAASDKCSLIDSFKINSFVLCNSAVACEGHSLFEVDNTRACLLYTSRLVLKKTFPLQLLFSFIENYPLTLQPVSYTHLDVYKRQDLQSIIRKRFLDF